MNFLQSALLAGLGLVAVPLLLHLLTRRRVREVVFPAVMFLLGTKRRSLKLLTLKQWLVLLCRMAAVACVVMAAALPVLRKAAPRLPGTKSPAAVYIIVDDTQSMTLEREGVTLIERAAAAAAKIVKASGREDEIYFETLCGGGGGAYTTEAGRKELLADLKEIEPRWCRADLGAAARRAADFLGKSPFSNRRLVLLSDFRENGLRASGGVDLAAGTALVAVDLAGGAGAGNVAVTDVRLPVFPLRGEELPVCYELESYGADETEISVSLIIEGMKRGERSVKAGGAGKTEGCFLVTLGESGRHAGVVAIDGDDMAADNERRFILDVRDGIRAAIVAAEEESRNALGDAFYIQRALGSASGAGPGEKPVEVRVVDPAALDAKVLAGAGVVFVPGGTRLTKEQLSLIGEYLAAGGGVFMTAGFAPDYGETISRTIFGGGIAFSHEGGARRGDDGGAPVAKSFLTPERMAGGHPVFSGPAGGRVAEGILRAGFSVPMKISSMSPGIEALVSLPGGGGFLVERRLGKGKVMLLAGGLGPESTNFSLMPGFVPFILQAARYLSAGPGGAREFSLGTAISIAVENAPAGRLEAVSGSGAGIVLKRINEGGRTVLAPETPPQPGIYRIKDEAGADVDVFAVNAPVDESSLEVISRAERRKVFRGGDVYWLDAGRSLDAEKMTGLVFDVNSAALWYLFSVAAVCFLLAESTLANRR